MLLDSVILFTKDRREFTWLESVCAPNYKVVIAFQRIFMFGTKLKHKIFSSVLFLFAAIVFIGIALSVSEHRAVSFGNVSSFGAALVLLSFALIPEFVFSNKLRKQTQMDKISQKIFFIGMLIGVIGFIGKLAL